MTIMSLGKFAKQCFAKEGWPKMLWPKKEEESRASAYRTL